MAQLIQEIPAMSVLLQNAESPSVGAWVRLHGVIEPSKPKGSLVAGFLEVSWPGAQTLQKDLGQAFCVELPDGQKVSARLKENVLSVQKVQSAWEQITPQSLLEPFRKQAPGPHVKVSCKSAVLQAGDTIELLGKIEEFRAAVETNDLRRAPTPKITKVSVHFLSTGEAANKKLEASLHELRAKQNRISPLQVLIGLGGLSGVLLLLGGLLNLPHVFSILSLCWGVGLLGLSYYGRYVTTARLPLFWEERKEKPAQAKNQSSAPEEIVLIIASCTLLPFSLFFLNPANDSTRWWVFSIGLLWILLLGVLFWALLLRSSQAKLARMMTNAPPSKNNGAWGALAGKICEPPDHKKAPDTFWLKSKKGELFCIKYAGALLSYGRPTAFEGLYPHDPNAMLLEGRRVLVVGRVFENRVESTGAESLLIFVCPDGEPETLLPYRLRSFRAAYLSLLIGVLTIIPLLIYVASS